VSLGRFSYSLYLVHAPPAAALGVRGRAARPTVGRRAGHNGRRDGTGGRGGQLRLRVPVERPFLKHRSWGELRTENQLHRAAIGGQVRGPYPALINTWKQSLAEFMPLLEFPIGYAPWCNTTNAIESVNTGFRQAAAGGQLPQPAGSVGGALPGCDRIKEDPGQPERADQRPETIRRPASGSGKPQNRFSATSIPDRRLGETDPPP
jgi:hypothetical protein